MTQDIDNIINSLSGDWAQDMINSKKKTAILIEENRVLKEANERLKTRIDRLTEGKEEKDED